MRRLRHARVLTRFTAHHRPPKLHTLHTSHRRCRYGYQELVQESPHSPGVRSPARCNHATPRRRREPTYSGATECMCHQWAPVRTGAGARPGTIPVREGTSRDTTEYYGHPPSPCNDGAARQPPPKTVTPAAHALTERDRQRYQPAEPLEGGPWRVRGGERGQTWACTAPGSNPTATASARAPALGGHGGHVPPRGATPDRVKCTERGRARAGRAVPRYYKVLRPPSQPLQARSAPRVGLL